MRQQLCAEEWRDLDCFDECGKERADGYKQTESFDEAVIISR